MLNRQKTDTHTFTHTHTFESCCLRGCRAGSLIVACKAGTLNGAVLAAGQKKHLKLVLWFCRHIHIFNLKMYKQKNIIKWLHKLSLHADLISDSLVSGVSRWCWDWDKNMSVTTTQLSMCVEVVLTSYIQNLIRISSVLLTFNSNNLFGSSCAIRSSFMCCRWLPWKHSS